jgi:hypothetical protein
MWRLFMRVCQRQNGCNLFDLVLLLTLFLALLLALLLALFLALLRLPVGDATRPRCRNATAPL